MTIIPSARDRFAIPDDVHYLNCAYMAPLAHEVQAAMMAGVDGKRTPWTYTPDMFFSTVAAFRSRAARLVGCTERDIAIAPSVSYALATAARNIDVPAGGEIVVLDAQFPSNVYAWQTKARDAGAHVVTVARDADGWTDAVLAAIGPKTAIVAVPQCHWADGGALDLVAIGAAAQAAGAALVLDLTQSLGAMPFDLSAVQPDYMVAATYKWLLGPYGTALIYIAPHRQDGVPLEENWMNRAGSEDFAGLTDYTEDYQPGAARFDMGEKSNPPLMNGAAAALDLIDDWGVENIAETLGARTAQIAAAARALGLTADDEPVRAPHFLSLGFPNGVPTDLMARLSAANVFVSLRGASLRVSPHLWTTD
ncbi:MAG: aminotransferase class V-fold PLP-dependent enzyme, partial [Pseudomonadota bacterium]